jgi:predicted Zn-dependent protease
VEAQPVTVVADGVLESFLMSRSPIKGFPHSNGHGRARAGYFPVARQSNLIVRSSDENHSETELREQLVALCREQNKEYGLYIADIQGGFTYTGRSIPNSFNLLATEVYRVYADGRPDEMVRGADMVGTPLVMFSMIEAVGDKPAIFNGLCGAESGYVPVGAVSPPLLVGQVEIQRKIKSQDPPPLLERP